MNSLSNVKRPFVFAALTVALLLASAFLPSRAGSVHATTAAYVRYSEEITYYSDPGLTNYVGTGTIYCNGHSTLTGTSSPYHTEEVLDVCCYGVPC
jgi:hypothetical protein